MNLACRTALTPLPATPCAGESACYDVAAGEADFDIRLRRHDVPAKTKANTNTGSGRGAAAPVEVPFSPEEIQELDVWIARNGVRPPSRPDAVRQLVQQALAIHREWDRAKATVRAKPDEGLRPEELTAGNDD
jgi:hypothetical protein